MNFPKNFQAKKGITLVEMVIYIAFIGVMAVFITNFMIQISNSYRALRAEREVVSNARLALEQINKIVAQASSIYSLTSRFNVNSGQLSLVTAVGATAGHTTAYVDFWVDNGRLWMKKEGFPAIAVSAPMVSVDYFYLERISQSLNRDAVRVTLKVSFKASGFAAASTTISSTAVLRGAY